MGLFKRIGNFFKQGVGKAILGATSIFLAPFTLGASLGVGAALGAFKGSGKKKKELTGGVEDITQKILPTIGDKPTIPSPTIEYGEPIKVVQKEAVQTTPSEQIIVKDITTPKKTDVTLFGFYSDINKLTVKVDNDVENIVVVPNTFFPYIVEFYNHPPSNGIRYMSEFAYENLIRDWETNLGKVINTLDRELSPRPYVRLDWQIFVDKYNNFDAGFLQRDGGILYGFTISPIFLLQWIDGPEVSNMLDYSFVIPPAVKTVFDFNPQQPDQPLVTKANVTTDPKRRDKLTKIIASVNQVGTQYAIAKAAIGGIKSIYGNTQSAVANLSDTANKLGDKFKDFKTALSKDAINGKISNIKGLIKGKKDELLGKLKFKKRFLEAKGELIAQVDPTLTKKENKRQVKDQKKIKKKGFRLPDFPDIPNLPSIPTLPTQLSLNNLNQLPGLGSLPNVGGLIAQGKGIVNGIGNINFKDPLALLNAPANILNSVSSLGDSISSNLGSASENLNSTNRALQSRQYFDQASEQIKKDAEAKLKSLIQSNRINPPLRPTPVIASIIPRGTNTGTGTAG
jgi:hypothetical protein